MSTARKDRAGARFCAWENQKPEWTRHVLVQDDNHRPPRGREASAEDHTRAMLRWWRSAGIRRADLAVRRSDGTMIWHENLPLDCLPLPWIRAENVRLADVYIRHARGYSWPLVFLDDVSTTSAFAVAGAYNTLVVKTSEAGGCHLWLSCSRSLDEAKRHRAQRWLVEHVAADPASTSGEHLGRLAGFKNHKRRGEWANVLRASVDRRRWDPVTSDLASGRRRGQPRSSQRIGPDRTPSGQDWAWACKRRDLDPENPSWLNESHELFSGLHPAVRRRARREPQGVGIPFPGKPQACDFNLLDTAGKARGLSGAPSARGGGYPLVAHFALILMGGWGGPAPTSHLR